MKFLPGRRLLICVAPAATWAADVGCDPRKWRGSVIGSWGLQLWTNSRRCRERAAWSNRRRRSADAAARHRTHVVSAAAHTWTRCDGEFFFTFFFFFVVVARQPLVEADVQRKQGGQCVTRSCALWFGNVSAPIRVCARTCAAVLLVPGGQTRMVKKERSAHWWCHASEPQRRRRRHRAVDENPAGSPERRRLRLEGCGVRPEDVEQRGRRAAVSRYRSRCRRLREPPGEAGSPAQPARQAAHLQRAEWPEKRALPAHPKLPVQRAGETESLGVHLPRVRVSFACACGRMWSSTCWSEEDKCSESQQQSGCFFIIAWWLTYQTWWKQPVPHQATPEEPVQLFCTLQMTSNDFLFL